MNIHTPILILHSHVRKIHHIIMLFYKAGAMLLTKFSCVLNILQILSSAVTMSPAGNVESYHIKTKCNIPMMCLCSHTHLWCHRALTCEMVIKNFHLVLWMHQLNFFQYRCPGFKYLLTLTYPVSVLKLYSSHWGMEIWLEYKLFFKCVRQNQISH